MPASNFAEEAFIKASLEGTTLTAPTKLFVALCEKPITKTMTGTTIAEAGEGAELTYEGYARVEIKAEAAQWEFSAGSGESTASKSINKNAVTLKLNTNTTGKFVAKYFALCDAVTAGHVWFFGKLEEEVSIVKAITKIEIEPKKLTISCE